MPYGRPDDEWAELKAVGKKFLVERAVLQRLTTYTELNVTLVNRAASSGFDFSSDKDRAALGELLGQISDDTAGEVGGLLISALVQYLGANDAGAGFYALARQRGFTVPVSGADRQLFWAKHVRSLHARFATSKPG